MSPGFYSEVCTEPYVDDVCHGTADKDNRDPVELDAPLSDRCLREQFSQLREFFLLMRRLRLTIKPGKFFFFSTRMKLCGLVLMWGRRALDLEKTAAVMRWDWRSLKTPTHVKASLGLTQWYPLYLRGYEKVSSASDGVMKGP